MGRAVLQYIYCTCDTALGWPHRWVRGTRAAGANGRAGLQQAHAGTAPRAGGMGAQKGRGRGEAGARQERGRHAVGTARARGRWARPRRAAGQRAVYLVHSACFWPGLTQYCS